MGVSTAAGDVAAPSEAPSAPAPDGYSAPPPPSVGSASLPPLRPPAPPPVPVDAAAAGDADAERQALLRQLDLLRLKFKQSVIPPDIERQDTTAVRLIVERNLINLKRVRARTPLVGLVWTRGARRATWPCTNWAWQRSSWSWSLCWPASRAST